MTLAAATSSPMAQGLTLLIVGMGVVFTVLVLIAVLVTLMNRQPREPKPRHATPVPGTPDGIPPEHLAVIAGVASAMAARSGRRASLGPVIFLGHSSQRDWVAGGRATIMGSHAPHLRRDRTGR